MNPTSASGSPASRSEEGRTGAWARWAAFSGAVIGLPAAAFFAVAASAVGPVDAEAAGPAMLVFLATPAIAAFLLSRGLRVALRPRRPALGRAVGLTAALVSVTAGIAWLAGTLGPGPGLDPQALVGALLGAVVTSTVEELGWAAGGTTIARAALGPKAGPIGLGVLWAAWHLVIAALAPAVIVTGMFGAGPLSAPRMVCFVLGVVVYRVFLTALRDRADAWWPAAAAHVTGNVVLGGMIGSGAVMLTEDGPWWAFPGPTGVPFLLGAAALAAFARRWERDGG